MEHHMNEDMPKMNDATLDICTIVLVCFVAFIIGLLGGSFDVMVIITLPLYVGLRYLQIKRLI